MEKFIMSTQELVSLGKGMPVFDTLIEALKNDDSVDLEILELTVDDYDAWDDD